MAHTMLLHSRGINLFQGRITLSYRCHFFIHPRNGDTKMKNRINVEALSAKI